VESIPFPETRDYVKKVMANSVFYAAVLDQKPMPLKARLGAIQPPGASEPPIEVPVEAPVEDELR
jgi:soluble lytic murein transglycosylase